MSLYCFLCVLMQFWRILQKKHFHALPWASVCRMSARISSTFQTVVRGPSLTDCGYLPVLIPFHHAEALMPSTCSTWGSRTKPSCGIGFGGHFVCARLIMTIAPVYVGELCRAVCPNNLPILPSCGGVQADIQHSCMQPGRRFCRRGQAGVLSSPGCSQVR